MYDQTFRLGQVQEGTTLDGDDYMAKLASPDARSYPVSNYIRKTISEGVVADSREYTDRNLVHLISKSSTGFDNNILDELD